MINASSFWGAIRVKVRAGDMASGSLRPGAGAEIMRRVRDVPLRSLMEAKFKTPSYHPELAKVARISGEPLNNVLRLRGATELRPSVSLREIFEDVGVNLEWQNFSKISCEADSGALFSSLSAQDQVGVFSLFKEAIALFSDNHGRVALFRLLKGKSLERGEEWQDSKELKNYASFCVAGLGAPGLLCLVQALELSERMLFLEASVEFPVSAKYSKKFRALWLGALSSSERVELFSQLKIKDRLALLSLLDLYEQEELFKSLPDQVLAEIFPSLPFDQQQNLFKALGAAEQVALARALPTTVHQELIRVLSTLRSSKTLFEQRTVSEQIALFKVFDPREQAIIFKGLHLDEQACFAFALERADLEKLVVRLEEKDFEAFFRALPNPKKSSLLLRLSPKLRQLVFRIIDQGTVGEVFGLASPEERATLFDALNKKAYRFLFKQLFADKAPTHEELRLFANLLNIDQQMRLVSSLTAKQQALLSIGLNNYGFIFRVSQGPRGGVYNGHNRSKDALLLSVFRSYLEA